MFPTRRRIRAPFTRIRRWFGMCFRDRDEQTGFGGGFRARDRTCWHSCLSSSSQMNKNGWKPPFLLPLPVKICTALSKFQTSNKLLFVIFFFFFGHTCILYHCNVGQAYGFRQAWSNNEVQPNDDLPGQLPGEAPVSLPPVTFYDWTFGTFLSWKPGLSGLGRPLIWGQCSESFFLMEGSCLRPDSRLSDRQALLAGGGGSVWRWEEEQVWVSSSWFWSSGF